MKRIFLFSLLISFSALTTQCSDKVDNIIDDEGMNNSSEYIVENQLQLNSIVPALKPGDLVILQDGEWNDVELLFSGVGTETQSITFEAQTIGGVVLTGNSKIKIAGDYLVASGFSFKNGTNLKGAAVEFRNGSRNARYCRLTNTSIKDYSPSDKNIDTKWISLYGSNNRVDHCSMEGKTNSGTTLVVWKTKEPDYHLIDHNYFGERPDLGFNGGETIRIGTSDWSLYPSHTVVEHNLFEECDGEIEIISNKSCSNIYRYNTFLNSNGALTLRHGDDCEVYNNFFIDEMGKNGSGGVRIIGRRHLVYNNYFQGLNGTGYRSVISIANGMVDSPLNGYYQVEDAQVGFNTIVDCRQPFELGSGKNSSNTLPPVRVLVANNLIKNRVNTTMVLMKDVASDVEWEGNILDGTSGISQNEGIKNTHVAFTFDGSIMRPNAEPLESNLATAALLDVVVDIDLHERPSNHRHVGCDQVDESPVKNKPKSREEVGVRKSGSSAIASGNVTEDNFTIYKQGALLTLNFVESAKRTVTLFNINGQAIEHIESNGFDFNISSAHPGVYLLRVVKNLTPTTYKIRL